MSLKALAEEIRNFPGVTRKHTISEVINFFPKFSSLKILASYGEDAAVVEWDDHILLLAADGIMQPLMKANPFFAGYYSILVNLHDIAAMGGTPIAMLDVLSVKEEKVCAQVMKGMEAAINKFGVPIVGGHTHPDCTYNAIDVAIVGFCEDKDSVIFSHTAQTGDDVIMVMDLDGYYPEGLSLAWDTTSKKDAHTVRKQISTMNKVARKHLAHSGKDISNPGCLGTLGMMLETSGKGALVDVTKIPAPKHIEFAQWVKSYQGCGYVIACDPENSQAIIDLFASSGVTGAVVGKVDDSRVLSITDGDETEVLFDFNNEIITGCKPGSTHGWNTLDKDANW
ncbi:MAG: thiamine monophosphate kinase [Methanomassiliicoccales archaeon PtaU1.Bin124]|nr:MAG: thiamine monophosphate kinase [Methanomassiliicoccales archaeon PtaU1.Bin124]